MKKNNLFITSFLFSTYYDYNKRYKITVDGILIFYKNKRKKIFFIKMREKNLFITSFLIAPITIILIN